MSVDIGYVPRYKILLSESGQIGYVTRAVNKPLSTLLSRPAKIWSRALNSLYIYNAHVILSKLDIVALVTSFCDQRSYRILLLSSPFTRHTSVLELLSSPFTCHTRVLELLSSSFTCHTRVLELLSSSFTRHTHCFSL